MATKTSSKKTKPAPKGREHTIAKGVRDGMPPRRQPKTEEPAVPDATTQPEANTTPDDANSLCVFAFRLTRAERDLIHAATGSAKASKFVRSLAVAAARGDGPTVLGILDEIQSQK